MSKFPFKVTNKLKLFLSITFSLLLVYVSIFSFGHFITVPTSSNSLIEWNSNESTSLKGDNEEPKEKKYIKWFEFNVSYEVLDKTSKLDINSHTKNEDVKLNWIELISYLACKYGNDFSKFKAKDLDNLVEKLRSSQSMDELTKDMKNYNYYFEGYDAVLHEFIGNYQIEVKNKANSSNNTGSSANILNNNVTSSTNNQATNTENYKNATNEQRATPTKQFTEKYGIKAFHPVAKNYSYSHYDDFGASRSYGYRRLHFGNDLMGSIGSPIIAVESGVVEAARLESIWWLENWYS